MTGGIHRALGSAISRGGDMTSPFGSPPRSRPIASQIARSGEYWTGRGVEPQATKVHTSGEWIPRTVAIQTNLSHALRWCARN